MAEWQAFYSIEPFGEERADLRAASIVQAAISPWIKKGGKVPSLKDCMLNFDPESAAGGKEQTSEEILMIFQAAAKKGAKKQRDKGTK